LSRFDKVDPYGGSFRAKLAVALAYTPLVIGTNDVGKVWAVGMDASGNIVKGAGASGIVGVICAVRAMAIGEPIDVMVDGEIADFALQAGTAAAAGTRYYGVAADGTYAVTATGTPLGFTVEASRFVVHLNRTIALVTT